MIETIVCAVAGVVSVAVVYSAWQAGGGRLRKAWLIGLGAALYLVICSVGGHYAGAARQAEMQQQVRTACEAYREQVQQQVREMMQAVQPANILKDMLK